MKKYKTIQIFSFEPITKQKNKNIFVSFFHDFFQNK